MRILRIADVSDNRTGGMARLMHYMSDELRAAGHIVDLAFNADLVVAAPGKLRRFIVPFAVVREVRRRRRRGVRYDVVEVHEPSAAAYAFAARRDPALPPLLVFSHGVESRCLETMLGYLGRKGVRIGLKQRYAYRMTALWQSDYALTRAAQVALSTTDDRDYLIRRLGVSPDRVTIVNGGVTPTFLAAPPRAPAANGVLFLATWIDRKGIRDVVPAITKLLDRHPETPVTLAGFGCLPETVAAAFPNPVRSRIRLVPRVVGEPDLLRLYREHSVFLTPSVFEGQLLTMLEAAAAGLAVVGTHCGGMKDFIRDGETGVLVEPGRDDALASALIQLVERTDLAARYGAAAQAAAREYTWARSAGQFLHAARAAVACTGQR